MPLPHANPSSERGARTGRLRVRASVLAAAAACLLWLTGCAPATGEDSGEGQATGAAEGGAMARTLSRPEDRFFDVLTFNTALLPEPVSYTLPSVRAASMAPYLAGYDAVVLQEAFVDSWRERLIAELADSYPYRGDLVGRDGADGFLLRQDGDVVILSRWPIVRQATLTFGATCAGTDCLADKGVAYAAVRKGSRTYHLFGTHAQSTFGRGSAEVRAAQFALLADFVREQEIPVDEAVLLAGDFNVDAATPELATMLSALRASWPPVVGGVGATWDPTRNVWAEGRRLWLDYVLVADDHAAPAAAWNRAVPLRAGDLDLSDHFAVWGRVAMPLEP